ncbi:MAG: hypothetical protein EOP84_00505 [Verrucomicrobiaceae bacterium]|nr:MAG: hypothetical protein EOP84_00505 [Verrucomicrobiaceae bacterium]
MRYRASRNDRWLEIKLAKPGIVSNFGGVRLSFAALAVLALTAGCDDAVQETVVPSSAATTLAADSAPTPPRIERPTNLYTAVGPEAEAFGLLSVILPPGGVGGGRTFSFGGGEVLETELVGIADIAKQIGGTPMADALGLTQEALHNGGDPRTYLLKVNSEVSPSGGAKPCGSASPAYLLTRQLDTPADRTVTLVILTAAPGEPTASVCKKLVYTGR